MITAYIAFGSNLGDRLKNIKSAIKELKNIPQIKIEKISKILETEPEGGLLQPKYLNGVIKIKTSLSADKLLEVLQKIEEKLGRVRLQKNEPRTIDLDILIYGKKIINTKNLKVPHPRMFNREFVLKPLYQIEPNIKRTLTFLKNRLENLS